MALRLSPRRVLKVFAFGVMAVLALVPISSPANDRLVRGMAHQAVHVPVGTSVVTCCAAGCHVRANGPFVSGAD